MKFWEYKEMKGLGDEDDSVQTRTQNTLLGIT